MFFFADNSKNSGRIKWYNEPMLNIGELNTYGYASFPIGIPEFSTVTGILSATALVALLGKQYLTSKI